MTTPKPSAQGSLAKTPFPHLLLFIHGRQLTGTLAIWPDSDQDKAAGQDRILFQGGAILAVRPMAAAENASAALLRLFSRKDAPYGFYDSQNLLGSSNVIPERVDIYNLLARGLREVPREEIMNAMLSRLGGRALRIRAGVPLDRLDLTRKERDLIEVLRAGPASPDELIGSTDLPELDAKRIIYLLALIRGVEAADDGRSIPPPSMGADTSAAPPSTHSTGRVLVNKPADSGAPNPHSTGRVQAGTLSDAASAPRQAPVESVPSASGKYVISAPPPPDSLLPPPPPQPARLSAPDAARWTELTTLYAKLDSLNHFELLQVAPAASANDVSSAYFALVKKFHPDRLPEGLAPLSSCAQLLFDRITEANQILTNTESRAEYDKAVAAGGGTREANRMMRNVLESAMEFQKAEVLVKRRDYAQALQLIRSAITRAPEEGDYHAVYAWLLHLTDHTEAAPTDEMLRELDFALKQNPKSERAHYYKGVILKRLNRLNEATKHFKAAAEINPRNVDAVREVRLSGMRRDSKAPAGSGKLLSKLFGNKGDR